MKGTPGASRRPRKPPLAQLETERRALELRRAGVTFDAIADSLGFAHRSGAHNAVARALARNPEPAGEDVRALEVDRLDRMLVAVWQRAMTGDSKAMDQALKISERRARLLGLDAPTTAAQVKPPRPRLLVWNDDEPPDPAA